MKCPLCKSNKVNLQFSKDKYHFYNCKNCTIIFQFPIPKKEIERYYNYEYYSNERPLNQFSNYFVNQKDRRVLKLIKKYKSPGSLLDIGAGYGVFVKNAKEEGFEASGIEPNKNSVKIAHQKFNILLNCQFFDKNYKKEKKFDIITLFHVIEHILKPNQLIKDVKSKLKEGGMLVIETPNINSFNSRRMTEKWPFILPNEHLFYFSPQSLAFLLEREGFKIIYQERNGPFIHTQSNMIVKEIRKDSPSVKVRLIKRIYDLISRKLRLGDHILIIARKV